MEMVSSCFHITISYSESVSLLRKIYSNQLFKITIPLSGIITPMWWMFSWMSFFFFFFKIRLIAIWVLGGHHNSCLLQVIW